MYLVTPKIFFLTINAIIYTFSVHKKEYIKSMKNEQEYTIYSCFLIYLCKIKSIYAI